MISIASLASLSLGLNKPISSQCATRKSCDICQGLSAVRRWASACEQVIVEVHDGCRPSETRCWTLCCAAPGCHLGLSRLSRGGIASAKDLTWFDMTRSAGGLLLVLALVRQGGGLSLKGRLNVIACWRRGGSLEPDTAPIVRRRPHMGSCDMFLGSLPV
jgi:hypothetical protein